MPLLGILENITTHFIVFHLPANCKLKVSVVLLVHLKHGALYQFVNFEYPRHIALCRDLSTRHRTNGWVKPVVDRYK